MWEIIEVYVTELGIYSQLNKYQVKVIHWPLSKITQFSTISNIYSETTGLIDLHGMIESNFVWPRWPLFDQDGRHANIR